MAKGLANTNAKKPTDELAQIEKELRGALSLSENAEVSRQGNMIVVTFGGDTFQSGGYFLNDKAQKDVSQAGKVLSFYPRIKIQVSGHTDSAGSKRNNLILSKRRAQAVADGLIRQRVNSGMVQILGLGDQIPISSYPEENRRVEVRIIQFTG